MKLPHESDILVVGGGPAGLSAALTAAEEGANVLLVEKKMEIGVPVRCGELFPSFSESLRLMPEARSLSSFYDLLSEDAITNSIRKIRVFSPRNRVFEFDFEGYVLNRHIFEKTILREAESEGAIIKTAIGVRRIVERKESRQVLLDTPKGETTAETKFLICADGFPSKTGKLVGIKNHYEAEDIALCVQRKMTGVKMPEEDTVEMYISVAYAPGGFAWIIPKGGSVANVGLGARLSYLRGTPSISHYIEAFLKKHTVASTHFQNAKSSPLVGKILPVGGLSSNICGDRALLVGDAAGTVIAVNGCGIPPALVSGRIAGRVAARNHEETGTFNAYANEMKKELGGILQRGYLYRRIGDRFMHSDDDLERILHILTAKNLAKVIRCEPIFPLSVVEGLLYSLA